MKSGEIAMTENEAIDFIKNEINVMALQRNGAFGSPAANIFRTRNGAKRIETLEAIIGLITQLKQYQKIGTVKECREVAERLAKIENMDRIPRVCCEEYCKYPEQCRSQDEMNEICAGCKLAPLFELLTE